MTLNSALIYNGERGTSVILTTISRFSSTPGKA
jgi:hypothetical protein